MGKGMSICSKLFHLTTTPRMVGTSCELAKMMMSKSERGNMLVCCEETTPLESFHKETGGTKFGLLLIWRQDPRRILVAWFEGNASRAPNGPVPPGSKMYERAWACVLTGKPSFWGSPSSTHPLLRSVSCPFNKCLTPSFYGFTTSRCLKGELGSLPDPIAKDRAHLAEGCGPFVQSYGPFGPWDS